MAGGRGARRPRGEVGRSWPRLVEVGRGWPRLAYVVRRILPQYVARWQNPPLAEPTPWPSKLYEHGGFCQGFCHWQNPPGNHGPPRPIPARGRATGVARLTKGCAGADRVPGDRGGASPPRVNIAIARGHPGQAILLPTTPRNETRRLMSATPLLRSGVPSPPTPLRASGPPGPRRPLAAGRRRGGRRT